MLASDQWEIVAQSGLTSLFISSHIYFLYFAWQMQEVFDPPEMEGETETEFDTCTSIRKDVVFEQDPGSSYRLCMCPGPFQRKPNSTWTMLRWACLYFPANSGFHSVGGNMKFEEDGHLLSQAKRDLLRVVHPFSW